MLLFEKCLKKKGAENLIENNRRSKRLERSLDDSKTNRKKLPAFLITAKRPTVRSVKFIRWIRNHLYSNTSWLEAAGSLKRIYAVF